MFLLKLLAQKISPGVSPLFPKTNISPIPSPSVVNPVLPIQTNLHYGFFHYFLLIIYFLICAGLITLVLLQTTKSEGLTGTLGGTSQSVFKGKKGWEEQLNQITLIFASAFIIFSILIAFFAF